jgi:hypothetical protein
MEVGDNICSRMLSRARSLLLDETSIITVDGTDSKPGITLFLAISAVETTANVATAVGSSTVAGLNVIVICVLLRPLSKHLP